MPEDDDRKSRLKAYRKFYLLGTVGTQLAVSIIIGTWMGLMLDRWLGTAPWLMLLFIVFGVAAGFLNVYRAAMKEESD
ncbi:MAG: AtpZ/AtpI family protein [Nitrospinae bacterium]|nr:AtpZ/AtpI family protein [Nitrospinota bacterium]